MGEEEALRGEIAKYEALLQEEKKKIKALQEKCDAKGIKYKSYKERESKPVPIGKMKRSRGSKSYSSSLDANSACSPSKNIIDREGALETKKSKQASSSDKGKPPKEKDAKSPRGVEESYLFKARALDTHKSKDKGDLSFAVGSIIEIIEEQEDDYVGRLGKKVGKFPSYFVKRC